MFKRVRNFLGEYKQLTFVIIAIIIGLILDLTGQDSASHWLLGVSAGIATVPLLWNMAQTLRDGAYGIDILAATAIITSVALQQYWAAIIIVLMLTGGEGLEEYAEKRAKGELTALLKQKPKKAHLLRGTKTLDVAVKTIDTGDKLVVLPGEVIPVDAIILEGTTSIDESKLTGESVPVEKTVGDELLSGSINVEGSITVQALRPEADSQYEQIVKLVRTASAGQSPFVRLADRYSIPFTVVSFIIAGTAWVITGDAIRFLEVLVVATPCPLLLGAPIALISGMSRAAKHGIIVKTGSALERLAEVQTFAFDKTGTLTMGKPTVSSVRTYNDYSEAQVLHFAAALETNSRHVLAQAIIEAAAEHNLKVKPAKQVKENSGHGLSGRIEGKHVMVGRSSLITDNDIALPKGFKQSQITQTATLVAIDNKLAGVILFKDEIRPEAEETLKLLRTLGIKHMAMVTGDNEATALRVAKQLDITDIYPDCLPVDKLLAIEQLPKRPVAFVGDGVNDAPVLTASDVGIALGARGSTAASESADVVILHDDLARVALATKVARPTFSIARQSILIGILISLGLMGVFATGKFTAVQGALIQELVDVTVILNALRAHGPWKR
jgi:heavy metal translocating P-type ATPase